MDVTNECHSMASSLTCVAAKPSGCNLSSSPAAPSEPLRWARRTNGRPRLGLSVQSRRWCFENRLAFCPLVEAVDCLIVITQRSTCSHQKCHEKFGLPSPLVPPHEWPDGLPQPLPLGVQLWLPPFHFPSCQP